MRLRLGNVYSVFGMTLVVCCWWLGSLVSLWCLLHGYPTLKCSTLDVVRVAFTHSNGTAYSRILYVRAKRRNIRCWLFGSGLYARVFILTCSLSIYLCLSFSSAQPFAIRLRCAMCRNSTKWWLAVLYTRRFISMCRRYVGYVSFGFRSFDIFI